MLNLSGEDRGEEDLTILNIQPKHNKIGIKIFLILLLPIAVLLSLTVGLYEIDIFTIFLILISRIIPIQPSWSQTDEIIVLSIRLPRTLAVLLVGAALSSSGTAFQCTFRNPLVSEHILGTASAAGFGAALALLLGFGLQIVEIFAFGFGLLSVLIIFTISKTYWKNQTLGLVLIGVIFSSLFAALTSLIKYIADPWDKLPSISYWLMGSFSRITMTDVIFTGPVILIGLMGIMLIRWRMNVLSIGEEEAQSLGININKMRSMIILSATLMTAAAVSICGIIGWIGLIIPHIARMLFGPDHRTMLPASALIGIEYLLLVDILCRNPSAGEIPIGIVTSIVGLPIFLYLLKKTKVIWS